VLDVVDDRRGVALDLRRDTPGHLVRRNSRVLESHRDDRDLDVREDVGRHAGTQRRAHDAQGADQRQEQGENNKGIGAL
jgi:hypothetical protein